MGEQKKLRHSGASLAKTIFPSFGDVKQKQGKKEGKNHQTNPNGAFPIRENAK